MKLKPIDTILSIYSWFAVARFTTTVKSFHTQMGVHFEEISEMLTEITGLDEQTNLLLENAKLANHMLAQHLKSNTHVVCVKPENYIGYLDALCDQVVTATGCAYDCDFKFFEALDEVDRSNWSKFVDGKAIFDKNGKILKGINYFKPDLSKFI
jgi:predicted HAD superfamily Cof-like phosphohydrolase